MTTQRIEFVQVTCFEGGEKFTYAWEHDYEFDPEHDQIACVSCAKKLGDDSMHICLNCGAQFQSHSVWAEACSRECGDTIDLAVERAQQRQIDAHERYLESL
jgi:predicted amidophosphoribosyltransferase